MLGGGCAADDRGLFPGCELVDLREKGVKVHVLDKEFGIDSLLKVQTGQWFSLQEKYRAYDALRYGDFTQEYMNACGTEWESPGEWFKLYALIYFYGWANKEGTDFAKWILMDVAKYKLLVEDAGGLDKIGTYHENRRHGRASFYSIPLDAIEPAFITTFTAENQAQTTTFDDDPDQYGIPF